MLCGVRTCGIDKRSLKIYVFLRLAFAFVGASLLKIVRKVVNLYEFYGLCSKEYQNLNIQKYLKTQTHEKNFFLCSSSCNGPQRPCGEDNVA